MVTILNKEKTRKLFDELSKIGESHFDEDNRTGALNFAAVGLALTDISSSGADIAALAYSAFEDLNYHDVCALLSFAFPSLNLSDPSEDASEWLVNLERIAKVINTRGAIKVFTTWNNETMKHDTGTYRMVVTIEKVEDSTEDISE